MKKLVCGLILFVFAAFGSASCSGFSGAKDSGEPSSSEPPSPVYDEPVSTTFIYRLDTAAEKIYRASLDTATGELYEHDATDLPAGSNPVSMVMTVDKKYLFVAASATETIEAYSVNQTSGELTWVKSNDTYDFAPAKLYIEPQGEYLISLENHTVPGQLGHYAVIYLIMNDTLNARNHVNTGFVGEKITSDDTGIYYFVGSQDAVMSFKLDRTTIPQTPLETKGSQFGAHMNDFAYNSAQKRLFISHFNLGDYNNVLIFDDNNLTVSSEITINGGSASPFLSVLLNGVGDRLYYLGHYIDFVNVFSVAYGPTSATALGSGALPSGCKAKAMTFAYNEEFLVVGCGNGGGKTVSFKVQIDGTLTPVSTSVRSGMKVNEILAVTL